MAKLTLRLEYEAQIFKQWARQRRIVLQTAVLTSLLSLSFLLAAFVMGGSKPSAIIAIAGFVMGVGSSILAYYVGRHNTSNRWGVKGHANGR
jgi:hypothetical protein